MQRLRAWIKRYKWWAISLCLYGVVGFTMRQQGSIDLQWIAFAQDATETSSTASLIQNLNVILKIIYIIMWPLLVVAGLAMDNSLVLGEVFHLDKPLWQFRRIMTNFANFALGFMVIFYILKFVVGSKGDTKEVFDIIKKALIAGIGIQASRFLMLAALDISNIAIYSIGSIPTNVLEADANLGEKKVLRVHSTVDYAKFNTPGTEGESDESFSLFYSCGADQWQQCTFASGYMFNLTDADYCVLGGMYANDSIISLPAFDYVPLYNQEVAPAFIPDDVGYPAVPIPQINSRGAAKSRTDVQAPDSASAGCQTLGDLISGSKGFVGPLVTVYSSILDFASINLTDTQKTTGGVMIVFLLKTLIALALLIPMVMLCGVLIIRVGYLWFYMAFMPIYVIRWSFGLDFSILGKGKDSISNLVSAIFMPVVVVFALSMSLVFLTLTTEVMSPADTEKSAEFWGHFDIEKVDEDDRTIYRLPPTSNELHFKKPDQFYGASMFRDFFAYIFINLMAIGMMRLLYFAAMKTWTGMSESVEKRKGQAEKLMMKIPVVPVPGEGDGRVGLGTAFNMDPNGRGLVGRSLRGVQDKWRTEENAAIGNMMSNDDLNTDKEWKKAAEVFTGNAGIGFNDAAQRAIQSQGDTVSTSATYLDTESINEIAALGREDKGNAKAIATQNVIKDLEVQSGLEDANKRLTQWSNNTEISGRLRDDIKKNAGGMKFLTIAGGSHVLHVLGDKLTLSEVGPGMFGDKGAEDIAAIVAAQPIAMANQIMAKMDDPDKILGGRKDKEGTGEEAVYSVGGSKYTWNSESKQFVATGEAAAATPAADVPTKELHVQTSTEIQESLKKFNLESATEEVNKSLEPLDKKAKEMFEKELGEVTLELNDKKYKRSTTPGKGFIESESGAEPSEPGTEATDPPTGSPGTSTPETNQE